jgi:dihydrofolate synthase/folylpolyglutamate synthase
MQGLADTTWPCRFELVDRNPYTILDGGHNEAGARVLFDSLTTYFPGKKITFIFGVLKDKAYREMVDIVGPLAECFITVTPDSPRAKDAGELAGELQYLGYRAKSASSYEEALSLGREASTGILVGFGSLYFVGKLRTFFSQN